MWRWLVLPMVVFAYLAATVSAGAPRDRDRDRLPDRWERNHHLSPSKASAKRDPDRDRLSNRRELRLRTHPRRADTDRDRLRDGAEVRRFHTNPRRRDTDGDGFRDRCELRKGTNPRKRRSRPKRRCSKSQQAPPGQVPAPPGGSPQPTGGLPDASNTGVPAGTVLTPSGSMTITQAGAVISAREVTGSVTVNAPNVTIRNSRIQGNAFNLIRSNSSGLLVEDSEIVNQPAGGQPNCHNAIAFGGYTVLRTEITGCENGADMGAGNVLFQDNYVHDLDHVGPSHVFGNENPHADGIQMSDNARNIRILHNNISPQDEGSRDSTAGIIMGTANSDVRIEDNRIDGSRAAYAIYAPRTQTSNVFINRNRLLKGYGYTACVRLGVTVSEFNDNRDAVTDALLAPDNGADGGCTN
jgi:hypothetical protein